MVESCNQYSMYNSWKDYLETQYAGIIVVNLFKYEPFPLVPLQEPMWNIRIQIQMIWCIFNTKYIVWNNHNFICKGRNNSD